MPQEWYYNQGDGKIGPVSVKELKQAAADGIIQPTTLVWTEGMADWKEARTVKGLAGLWATQPTDASTPPPKPARRPTPTAKPVAKRLSSETTSTTDISPAWIAQQWWLIGLSLFCCFPVGLILVWLHPRMTKSAKGIITGVVGVLFIGLLIIGAIQEKRAKTTYTEAERAWASGNKKEATDKYRKLLEDDDTFLTDEQKPLVYGRVIDYDAESGNSESAVKLAEKALQRSIEPSVNHPAGQAAVAEAKKKQPSEDAPEWVEVAVAGAEKDRKKFTAAQSWGSSNRIDVMKKIVKKFKDTPDRLASNKKVQEHHQELAKLINEFQSIPFNGSYQSLDAKRMIDMWEGEVEGRYSGFHYNVMEEEMIHIVEQYKNRVH